MTDDLATFGSWHELVDALRPKSLKGRRVIKWKARVRRNRGLRTRKRKREQLRDRAKFVRNVVEGSASRARPNAPKLTRPRDMPTGRWFGLLVAMADREWTMPELCAVYERDTPTTHATVHRFMVDRGFVERRPNPNPVPQLIPAGMAAGSTRIWAGKWLYRATARGVEVANGAEWRKTILPNVNRYKHLRKRQAKARAGVEAPSG